MSDLPSAIMLALRQAVKQNPTATQQEIARRVLSKIPNERRDEALLWLLEPRVSLEQDRLRSSATREVKHLAPALANPPKPTKSNRTVQEVRQDPKARRAFDAYWSAPVRVNGVTKQMRDLTPEDCEWLAALREKSAQVLTDGAASFRRAAAAMREANVATLVGLPEETVREILN